MSSSRWCIVPGFLWVALFAACRQAGAQYESVVNSSGVLNRKNWIVPYTAVGGDGLRTNGIVQFTDPGSVDASGLAVTYDVFRLLSIPWVRVGQTYYELSAARLQANNPVQLISDLQFVLDAKYNINEENLFIDVTMAGNVGGLFVYDVTAVAQTGAAIDESVQIALSTDPETGKPGLAASVDIVDLVMGEAAKWHTQFNEFSAAMAAPFQPGGLNLMEKVRFKDAGISKAIVFCLDNRLDPSQNPTQGEMLYIHNNAVGEQTDPASLVDGESIFGPGRQRDPYLSLISSGQVTSPDRPVQGAGFAAVFQDHGVGGGVRFPQSITDNVDLLRQTSAWNASVVTRPLNPQSTGVIFVVRGRIEELTAVTTFAVPGSGYVTAVPWTTYQVTPEEPVDRFEVRLWYPQEALIALDEDTIAMYRYDAAAQQWLSASASTVDAARNLVTGVFELQAGSVEPVVFSLFGHEAPATMAKTIGIGPVDANVGNRLVVRGFAEVEGLVSLESIAADPLEPLAPTPDGFFPPLMYHRLVTDVPFDTTATVTLNCALAELSSVNEAGLRLFAFDGSSLFDVTLELDIYTNSVEGSLVNDAILFVSQPIPEPSLTTLGLVVAGWLITRRRS